MARPISAGILALLCALWIAIPCASQTVGDMTARSIFVDNIRNSACACTVSVPDGAGFGVGDRVVLVQARGGQAQQEKSTDSGSVITAGASGSFEFGTIVGFARQNRDIILSAPLVQAFNVTNNVQIVKVITGDSLVVDGRISAWPWFGCGGVVAIEARVVNLRGSIDVAATGFAGGATNTTNNTSCSITMMHGPSTSSTLAGKGESFVRPVPGKENGRAALGLGGGGGACHNSGGGGGANAGTGGCGGNQWEECVPAVVNGGLGGFACPVDPTLLARLWFGAGGGAGHSNDGTGVDGGRGGGLVVIRAQAFYSNGATILASGESPAKRAGRDGAGGGGGGGTVLLDVASIVGNVVVDVTGGKGADVNDPQKHGPGGGGGGGWILYTTPSVPVAITQRIRGGANGTNLRFDNPWGAQAGAPGIVRFANMPTEGIAMTYLVRSGKSLDYSAVPVGTVILDSALFVNQGLVPAEIGAVVARQGLATITGVVPPVGSMLLPGAVLKVYFSITVAATGPGADTIDLATPTPCVVTEGDRRSWTGVADPPCPGEIRLSISPPADLGEYEQGTVIYDTLVVVNRQGSLPIAILDVTSSSADVVITGAQPPLGTRLGMGDTMRVFLAISVSRIGREESTFGLIDDRGCTNLPTTMRSWTGLEPDPTPCHSAVTITDASATIGERTTIYVLLTEHSRSLVPPQAYTARLECAARDLAASTATVQGAVLTSVHHRLPVSTLDVSGTWTGGDTLCAIGMLSVLSANSRSTVAFASDSGFVWTGQCSTSTSAGIVTAGSICASTARVVSIGAGVEADVHATPTGIVATLTGDVLVPCHVRVYSLLGDLVAWHTLAAGIPMVVDLPAGRYLIQLWQGNSVGSTSVTVTGW